MQFLRHLLVLVKDLFGFARQNKIWWIAPLVILLLVMAMIMIVGQTVAPFIYTLF